MTREYERCVTCSVYSRSLAVNG